MSTRQYERTIQCKNTGPNGEVCGADIGLFEGKWYDVKSDISHTKVCKFPRQFKRRSTFAPKDLEVEGFKSILEEINSNFSRQEQVLKDILEILSKVSFETGSGKKVKA